MIHPGYGKVIIVCLSSRELWTLERESTEHEAICQMSDVAVRVLLAMADGVDLDEKVLG